MYDQQKADVFQAGMCLLQTATLSSCPLVIFADYVLIKIKDLQLENEVTLEGTGG